MNEMPNQKVSHKLQMMLEKVHQVFGNARNHVLEAYNQALSEGFKPHEAKELLLSSVKSISRRTVYLYLPDEAKDKKMQNIAKKSLQNCSDTVKNHEKNEQESSMKVILFPGKVVLSDNLADIIYDRVRSDKSNGYPYTFLLTHDGRNVTSVEDYELEESFSKNLYETKLNDKPNGDSN